MLERERKAFGGGFLMKTAPGSHAHFAGYRRSCAQRRNLLQRKPRQHLLKRPGLGAEFFAAGRHFLGAGGNRLGGFGDAVNGRCYFDGTRSLLHGDFGDLADLSGSCRYALDDLLEGRAGVPR